jgi:hypothetical protein
MKVAVTCASSSQLQYQRTPCGVALLSSPLFVLHPLFLSVSKGTEIWKLPVTIAPGRARVTYMRKTIGVFEDTEWLTGQCPSVDVVWTCNVSRHMVLPRRGDQHFFTARGLYVLELFALPCAFAHDNLIPDGLVITADQRQEIFESYGLLFHAWPEPLHVKYGRILGIRRFCWCWACSAHRYHQRVLEQHKSLCSPSTGATGPRGSPKVEFDPKLIDLINTSGQATDWSNDMFPSLWQRIITLDNHLRTAKPKSIWALLRDRRDTLQYYTFL